MKRSTRSLCLIIGLLLAAGCADESAKQRDFHTSGNREADERADQRVAQIQQIRGEGENGKAATADAKPSLFERVGGDAGVAAITDDFLTRAINDPRVNFTRKGVTKGGVLGVGGTSAEWQPTKENLAVVKKHIAQFLTLATGGPAKYDGLEMKGAHAGMKITDDEFDAAVGDMKATLDSKQIPTEEQKELLAILESTRAQIVAQ